ncbi:MAG: hypothetical protein HGA31_04300 [Candidatus Moranbacteria bacterium]|nr:hypothetical protein [Candidatus Moranbacteria bacterium]
MKKILMLVPAFAMAFAMAAVAAADRPGGGDSGGLSISNDIGMTSTSSTVNSSAISGQNKVTTSFGSAGLSTGVSLSDASAITVGNLNASVVASSCSTCAGKTQLSNDISRTRTISTVNSAAISGQNTVSSWIGNSAAYTGDSGSTAKAITVGNVNITLLKSIGKKK